MPAQDISGGFPIHDETSFSITLLNPQINVSGNSPLAHKFSLQFSVLLRTFPVLHLTSITIYVTWGFWCSAGPTVGRRRAETGRHRTASSSRPYIHCDKCQEHRRKQKQTLRGLESANELYRLSDRHWSADFGTNFCG
jgi:hypothetical protein